MPPLDEGIPKMNRKPGHYEATLSVAGFESSTFHVILRQSRVNTSDFSVILAVHVPGVSNRFRLRRYNGNSHEHRNQIEGDSFDDFHIHVATERYQKLGMREDAFAQPTNRYATFEDAFHCLIEDANIALTSGVQRALDFSRGVNNGDS